MVGILRWYRGARREGGREDREGSVAVVPKGRVEKGCRGSNREIGAVIGLPG